MLSPSPDLTLSPEAKSVLVQGSFRPDASGAQSAELIALNNAHFSVPGARAALGELAAQGLIEERSKDAEGAPAFCATPRGWVVRERLLAQSGRRHAALVEQRRHRLADLVLAVLMAPVIWNERSTGGFLAGSGETGVKVVAAYLHEWSKAEIEGCVNALATEGLVTQRPDRETADYIVMPTVTGRLRYRGEVAPRLRIVDHSTILDEDALDLFVFFAWQSWVPTSRNQIRTALHKVIARSAAWGLPGQMRLEEAVSLGDGAVRIDAAILEKIQKATFFVADITPYHFHADTLIPNPNVLVEVGYALASKEPVDIFLLASEPGIKKVRRSGPSPFPFDMQSVHRIAYDKPADLLSRLERELRSRLVKKRLIGESP